MFALSPPVDEVGTGLSGKGSETNVRSDAPFWIRPLDRPQSEFKKDWASLLESVVVGKGRDVLEPSENWEAADEAGTTCEDT